MPVHGTVERTTSHQPTMRPPSSATNCGLPVRTLCATNLAVSSIGNGAVCASQTRSAMTAAVQDANPAMSPSSIGRTTTWSIAIPGATRTRYFAITRTISSVLHE